MLAMMETAAVAHPSIHLPKATESTAALNLSNSLDATGLGKEIVPTTPAPTKTERMMVVLN